MCMADVVGHPSQVVSSSDGSANWLVNSRLFWMVSLISSVDTCSNVTSYFAKGVHNAQHPSDPNRCTAPPSSDTDQILEWLTVARFIFSRTFSVPHCCKLPTFHRLWSFFSKMGRCCCVSAASRRGKSDSPIFFLWNLEPPKHHIDSRIQLFSKCFVTLIEDMWGISETPYVMWRRLFLVIVSIHSSAITTDLPGHCRSSRFARTLSIFEICQVIVELQDLPGHCRALRFARTFSVFKIKNFHF